MPLEVARQNDTTEIILAFYGGYTGSFDNITVTVDDASACEKLIAESRYRSTQFSVLVTTDRRGCASKKRLSTVTLAAIVVSAVLLLCVIVVIVLLLFAFPNVLKRQPKRPRTRIQSLSATY